MGLLVLVALAGCSSGGGDGDAASNPTAGTSPPALRPAGTALWDGLVVPEGARLAGEIFVEPSLVPDAESEPLTETLQALMVLEGDPFAAWDDLTGQLRSMDVEMPGSADSCTWTFPDGGLPERNASNESEEVDLVDVNVLPPHPDVAGLECSAQAPVDGEAGGEGPSRTVRLHLILDEQHPATMALTAASSAYPARPPSGFLQSIRRQVQDSEPPPPPGPGPVPDEARDHVPEAASQPDPPPQPGEEFGTAVNCFADDGYSRTVLPEGTRLVATGWDRGSTSVIEAVEDTTTDDAIDALGEQFEGPGPDQPVDQTIVLDEGAEVRLYSFSVSAGGGACAVLSSPDGRFLRITRNAD